jgi:hypothetical protein
MSLIKRKTVEINGARVTVRSSTGWTATDRHAVMRDLYRSLGKLNEKRKVYEVGPRLEERIEVLGMLIAQTESVEGDLGFAWPGETATDDELRAVHEGIDGLPADAVLQWIQAINLVDKAPGNPDLAPEADETVNPK